MDEYSDYIYIYTRWGVEYVTPSIDLAYQRSQDGVVKQLKYHGPE